MSDGPRAPDWLLAAFPDLSVRQHGVSLERVQRIHLGIDAEPMAFSEETLASMIADIAEQCGDDEAFVLHAVVRALRGEDDHHRLTLRQSRRGRWQSPTEDRVKHRQHLAWVIRLDRMKARGWPTEAAIHQIAQTTGKSVSKVYAGIAEEERYQRWLRETAETLDRGAPE